VNFLVAPFSLTWRFMKSAKTIILVMLVVISVTLNVTQFTGGALAALFEATVKSTFGLSSVAAKGTARVTELTKQVANLNTAAKTTSLRVVNANARAVTASNSAAKLTAEISRLNTAAKAASLRAINANARAVNASTSAAKLTDEVSGLKLMLANANSSAKLAQSGALAKQKAKLKAKARLKRSLVAIPLMGVGLAVLFEEQDYREWAIENPNTGRTEYACEVAKYSAEVIDEVVSDTLDATQDWPERMKPDAEWIKSKLTVPKCDGILR
jgi:hypothetical protein